MTADATARTRLGWVGLAGIFLAGQGFVQLANAVAGLMIVRLLPVDQYALYTVAATLTALLAFASNPGISQAIITQGAASANDRRLIGELTAAGLSLSHRLYLVMLPVFIIVSVVMLAPHDWPLLAKIAIVALVAASGWVRVPTMVASAVFNLRHDSQGLFLVGIGEGLLRLALVPLCFLWPKAVLATLIGLLGTGVARSVARQRLSHEIDAQAAPTPDQLGAIRRFVMPLVPIILYTAFQGQISVLVLSLFGNTTAIANVGAITRLNQIISIGMLLNPFLVQPVLARQLDRGRFLNRFALILAGLAIVTAVVMTSAYLVPAWWLWILGGSYSGLQRELPVTLAAAMLGLIGGTLYTVVISRNRTGGQYWPIVPSIAGQGLFVALHGVSGTFDALLLGLIPSFCYAVVQAALLVRIVVDWR